MLKKTMFGFRTNYINFLYKEFNKGTHNHVSFQT